MTTIKNVSGELFAALVLLVLLAVLLDPFDYLMSGMFAMMILALLVAVFAVFAGLVWRESARDEREYLHRMLAGRIAFIAGSGTLIAGIVVQSFSHALDPWLVLALGAMILAKIAARAYGKLWM